MARYGLLALPLALVLMVPARCARAGDTERRDGLLRVRRAGVLRWGADLQGGEPFASMRPDGTVVGFEVDLAKSLARELGVQDELVQSDWSNLVPALERGTFDVAMNGIEVTDARRGRVRFTRPYYVFAERLIARRGDARITASLSSLAEKRVGTLANSLAHRLLLDARAEPVLYEGVQEPYLDLTQGRTDAVLLDDIIASRYGEPMRDLEVLGDVAEGTYAIAVRPDDESLAQALDAALDRVATSGELEAILARHAVLNDRQRRVLARAEPPTAAPPVPQVLGSEHVLLFAKGAAMTLLVSALAMLVAFPLGLALAIARTYGGRFARGLSTTYVELFRGTPVLLQLYVLYFGLAPVVKLGALPAAILGLGLNYAAYEAEAHRAGIQAVPRGQWDAAMAAGMGTPLALRRVILPQAVRLALPNVTSDFVALMKDSSLVSVITVVELTKQMTITAVDVRGWLGPGLLCAAFYLALSLPLARLARKLEARPHAQKETE